MSLYLLPQCESFGTPGKYYIPRGQVLPKFCYFSDMTVNFENKPAICHERDAMTSSDHNFHGIDLSQREEERSKSHVIHHNTILKVHHHYIGHMTEHQTTRLHIHPDSLSHTNDTVILVSDGCKGRTHVLVPDHTHFKTHTHCGIGTHD